MATQERSKSFGGFDYELVDPPPPDILQTECPVCLLTVREPYQVKCCGYSYCHSCIECIEAKKAPCPTCKHSNVDIFPDKNLQKEILELKVYCTLKKDGCDWTGKMEQLHLHLNEDPQPEKRLNGCQFVKVDCFYECGDNLQRQYMEKHESELCPKRPFSCEHCHNYESNYQDVTSNHWPVCGYFPIYCPKECGSFLQRKKVDSHIENECPLTVIKCDFHHVGCTVELHRKDIPEHLRKNIYIHTFLLATSFSKISEENTAYKNKISMLKKENEKLIAKRQELVQRIEKEKLEPIEHEIRHFERSILKFEDVLKRQTQTLLPSTTIPLGPHTLIMKDFQKLRVKETPWYSPPVYTHHQGYKIGLVVFANGWGDGKGKYLSVFVHFIGGEFDNTLKWPFRGEISFQLLDQISGKQNVSYTVIYNDQTWEEECSRVTEGEFGRNLGPENFIAQSELKPTYLQQNTLLFQIYLVKLY